MLRLEQRVAGRHCKITRICLATRFNAFESTSPLRYKPFHFWMESTSVTDVVSTQGTAKQAIHKQAFTPRGTGSPSGNGAIGVMKPEKRSCFVIVE
jgi:hypothetical protein